MCNNNQVDDISHFLIYCPNTKLFWRSFFSWWNGLQLIAVHEEEALEECIIFGFPGISEEIKLLNYLVIHAKYFIYIKKLDNINKFELYTFLIKLKQTVNMECDIYTRQKKALSWN